MAKTKQKFIYSSDGILDIQPWLATMEANHSLSKDDVTLLEHTHQFIQRLAQGLTTFYGRPYVEESLEIAETLLTLKLDKETAAAGMLSALLPGIPFTDETIRKELGETISKLIIGMRKTDMITALQKQKSGNQVQIDKIRKMLLAMATDIRVVLIKLAERLTFMNGIKSIPEEDRQRFAQEIFDIYAPLANRLGIGQIKWKLEDLAFRYQYPDAYKNIAKFLAERRTDREIHIHKLIINLQNELKAAHIRGKVTGRAKHIYSIYLKMQRKDVEQTEIYDHSAIRVLVPTIQDCYTTLSIVNSLWPPIMQEFDDYIANPKPNGYRSIHTAVRGPDNKYFEIQIRTDQMHEESERGVAAHWLYKEGAPSPLDDRTKMAYLQKLIGWHQEIANVNEAVDTKRTSLSDDPIYVITPAGDIMDLPQGSTPIDFAYHIHSDIGHRCRGAKINGHIVPLTYTLRTGDKIDIHTIAEGGPSRDWLNPDLDFIKTSRAKSKIMHWFKQQAFHQDIATGKQILDRELARSGLTKSTSVLDIARHFTLKNEEELLAAIGRGLIGGGQIAHAIQPKPVEKVSTHPTFIANTKSDENSKGSAITGASDLLTRYAKCCKPIPGESIIGYITQTSGISIHKKNCRNVPHLANPNRFINVDWDNKKTSAFITDLKILAHDREKLLHDLTALFVQEKIKLLGFNANAKKDHGKIAVLATMEIQNIDQLELIKRHILQLSGVIEVMRVKK
jgi:GTP pyrophosphokinase